MIRPATTLDTPAILDIAVASGLFPADATGEVAAVLSDSLASRLGPDHAWVVDDDGGPVGVAYFAPERVAAGAWNLYMLAVRPDRQRRGNGALVRHVEQAVAARDARLLLVETSGLATFERTRAFYRACGYEEEARVRDFYDDGEDKVIFRKRLAGDGPPA